MKSNPVNNTEKFKNLHKSYTLGLFCPAELEADLRAKLIKLSQQNPEKFEVWVKGFDLARKELAKSRRLAELKRRKSKSRSKDIGRGR